MINLEQHDNIALVNVNTKMLAQVCTDPCATPILHILLNEVYRYVLSSHLASMKENYSSDLFRQVDNIKKILLTPHSVFYGMPLYVENNYCGEFNIESTKNTPDQNQGILVDIRRSWSYILPGIIKDIRVRVVTIRTCSKLGSQSEIVVSHRGIERIALDPRCLLTSY
mgnify:CR=1 FL=1